MLHGPVCEAYHYSYIILLCHCVQSQWNIYRPSQHTKNMAILSSLFMHTNYSGA